jgi:hypothetical protein
VQQHPEIDVRIFSGSEPGLLTRVLLDADARAGTRITAR